MFNKHIPESTKFVRVPNEQLCEIKERASGARSKYGGNGIITYQEKAAKELRNAKNSRS